MTERLTVEEFLEQTAKPKKKKKRGRKKSEYAERYAAVPVRTPVETANLPAQRSLFELHAKNDVCIRLGLPPSVNAYWRTRVIPGKSFASTYRTAEADAYIESVKVAWIRHWNGWPPDAMTGKLRLFVLVHFPDARGRDLDNLAKALQDALAKAGAMANDSQIKHLSVMEGAMSKPVGCIDCWLESISDAKVS